MTLSPELALAYLKELSADYRSGVVLDAAGVTLAGDERLAGAARAALGSDADGREAGAAGALEGATDVGKVFAIRTSTHAIVITTGPFALPRVTRQDLQKALAGMGAETAQETPVHRIPHDSVEALLEASN